MGSPRSGYDATTSLSRSLNLGLTFACYSKGMTRVRPGFPTLLYVLPAGAVYGVFILWPLVRLALLSLMQWNGVSLLSSAVFVGLRNYGALFQDPEFGDELLHSLWWLGVTLVVPALIGLGFALLLRSVPRAPRGILRALLLVPLLLPTVVIATAWRLIYNPLSGPLSSALRALNLNQLALAWLGDPNVVLPALLAPACWASYGLAMLLCEAALGAVSPAVTAAAHIDGAGAWTRFRYITLPYLRGVLPLAMIVTALTAAPSYDLNVLLGPAGGPGYASTTLTLTAYGKTIGGQGDVGGGAAAAVLQAIAALVLAAAALLLARAQASGEESGERDMALSQRRQRRLMLLSTPLAIAATALFLFPIAWLVVVALQTAPGQTLATTVGTNLGAVRDQGFGDAFAASFAIGAIVAAGTLLVSLPAAYALATTRRRWVQGVAAVALALGLFQPMAVLIVPLYGVLNTFDLLDTAGGVILPQIARVAPLAVLILWAGVSALPPGVIEAARIDGAAPRQVLTRIALPLVVPLVAAASVWAFLTSWNDYLLPLAVVLQNGPGTVPLVLAKFVGSSDTLYGQVATGALCATLPVLLLYGLFYGILSRGIRGLAPRLQPVRP